MSGTCTWTFFCYQTLAKNVKNECVEIKTKKQNKKNKEIKLKDNVE